MNEMEKDFRDYIAGQVYQNKGVYACRYCKHRESGKYEVCDHEDCDGVTMWEYGEPEEAGG